MSAEQDVGALGGMEVAGVNVLIKSEHMLALLLESRITKIGKLLKEYSIDGGTVASATIPLDQMEEFSRVMDEKDVPFLIVDARRGGTIDSIDRDRVKLYLATLKQENEKLWKHEKESIKARVENGTLEEKEAEKKLAAKKLEFQNRYDIRIKYRAGYAHESDIVKEDNAGNKHKTGQKENRFTHKQSLSKDDVDDFKIIIKRYDKEKDQYIREIHRISPTEKDLKDINNSLLDTHGLKDAEIIPAYMSILTKYRHSIRELYEEKEIAEEKLAEKIDEINKERKANNQSLINIEDDSMFVDVEINHENLQAQSEYVQDILENADMVDKDWEPNNNER